MSSLNGKTLKFAKLHEIAFVPNVGNIGPTLDSVAGGAQKAYKMTIQDPWVIVETIDKNKKAVSVHFPIVAFTHVVVDNT